MDNGVAMSERPNHDGHRRTLPVLMYHDVGSGRSADGFRDYVVEPSLFDEHLSALHGGGFTTFPASELPALETRVDPERAIVITFDDGFASFADCQTALAKYKMTAAVFVPTAFIGGRAAWLDFLGEGHRPILGWQELRDLHGQGMEIGGHGDNHLQLDLIPRELLQSELGRGRAVLEDGLGA